MALSKEIGIDLGTANILIYVKGEGIVVNEPSVVSIDEETKKPLAVGQEAKDMLGKTPGRVQAIRPLKDGVIADFRITEILLPHFIYKFNLKGILYFPRINTEYDSIEGTIKLYNNQVFIADNIKEVIPEFLMVLKGVIDCPDLPLNVSRSALQNDGFVQKISEYISKKVADKLSGMCKTDKENYEKYWDDISPFIKFGCLKDEKFCEKMSDYVLFKNLDHKYMTLKECIEKNGGKAEPEEKTEGENAEQSAEKKETEKTTIYYVTDEQQQSQYINMFKKEGLDAVILSHNIDSPFITQMEQKNEHIKFQRIDADLTDHFKEDVSGRNLPQSTWQ